MGQSGRTEQIVRVRRGLRVSGIVQGVGFRPHVYRLARELGLSGFVRNDDKGVSLEVQGLAEAVAAFESRLISNPPPLAHIDRCEAESLSPQSEVGFRILESASNAPATAAISPDLATCPDCLRELFDPNDRRYRYPFINCTNCGPRFTIIRSLPYDRPATSMAPFALCPVCEREFRDPGDRRFHAQPNACPVCGPKLWLEDKRGIVNCDDPIAETVSRIKRGEIAAIRGLGGFHLVVDATNDKAVRELRLGKGREEKPLALMAPDTAAVERFCCLSDAERTLLEHHTRPIVLLRARDNRTLAGSVAPGHRYLGFMLPYTPLHHLLLRGNFEALVMTSGNLSEEPIAIANEEARQRLRDMADCFLLHDREILQRCDDSIARVAAEGTRIIRRARGYVPEAVTVPVAFTQPVLACGGELKNTIGLGRGDKVFLSQHIGDLDNPTAYESFEHCIGHLQKVLEIVPACLAHDLHPEYLSTKWAGKQERIRRIAVQHHHAHLVAVMTENGVTEPTIGIILDGTGYGTDGTIWGGEVLIGDASGFERFAWLEPVPMPGGEAAIRQPWRMAVSWLNSVFGNDARKIDLPLWSRVPSGQIDLLIAASAAGVNAPVTSSCGRLFDAVSAMLGLCHEVTYEAQGAILLEMAATDVEAEACFMHQSIDGNGAIPVSELIKAIIGDVESGQSTELIAARFHITLAEMFVKSAEAARANTGINRVGLSGGVFQNKLLFEKMVELLSRRGFDVLTHRLVPTNDGGLALGQAVVAAAKIRH